MTVGPENSSWRVVLGLQLELVELLALSSGDAPLTDESHGPCRLRLIGSGDQRDVAFADSDRARDWIEQLMSRSRCEL